MGVYNFDVLASGFQEYSNRYAEYFGSESSGMAPSTLITGILGVCILLGLLTFTMKKGEGVLPGVPELKGYPILGVMPIYLKFGMPQLLGKLIAKGEEGIAYADVSFMPY